MFQFRIWEHHLTHRAVWCVIIETETNAFSTSEFAFDRFSRQTAALELRLYDCMENARPGVAFELTVVWPDTDALLLRTCKKVRNEKVLSLSVLPHFKIIFLSVCDTFGGCWMQQKATISSQQVKLGWKVFGFALFRNTPAEIVIMTNESPVLHSCIAHLSYGLLNHAGGGVSPQWIFDHFCRIKRLLIRLRLHFLSKMRLRFFFFFFKEFRPKDSRIPIHTVGARLHLHQVSCVFQRWSRSAYLSVTLLESLLKVWEKRWLEKVANQIRKAIVQACKVCY